MGRREINIAGRRYGRLVALRRAEDDKYKRVRWLCVCDCGREVIVHKNNLTSGRSRSCGCLRNDILDERTHGGSTLGQQEPKSKE